MVDPIHSKGIPPVRRAELGAAGERREPRSHASDVAQRRQKDALQDRAAFFAKPDGALLTQEEAQQLQRQLNFNGFAGKEEATLRKDSLLAAGLDVELWASACAANGNNVYVVLQSGHANWQLTNDLKALAERGALPESPATGPTFY